MSNVEVQYAAMLILIGAACLLFSFVYAGVLMCFYPRVAANYVRGYRSETMFSREYPVLGVIFMVVGSTGIWMAGYRIGSNLLSDGPIGLNPHFVLGALLLLFACGLWFSIRPRGFLVASAFDRWEKEALSFAEGKLWGVRMVGIFMLGFAVYVFLMLMGHAMAV